VSKDLRRRNEGKEKSDYCTGALSGHVPYLGIVDEIEKKLLNDNPDMLKIMLTGLEKEYHPQASAL